MRLWLLAALSWPLIAGAQGFRSDETFVGSERELYMRARALAYHEVRPDLLVRTHSLSGTGFRPLRPALFSSANSAFPWLSGRSWSGKGLNAAASAGAVGRWGHAAFRLEPFIAVASNAAFELESNSTGFRDAMRPLNIDSPQRFGDKTFRMLDLGESYARLSAAGVSVGLSNERLFWGPGVRHALLFSESGPGFPRLHLGLEKPTTTPLGWVFGQVIYGRLAESSWSPPSSTSDRLGTGFVGWWSPFNGSLSLGGARFYHREWPASFRFNQLLAPFGSLFVDEEAFGDGLPDNQLVSLFASLRVERAGLEVFGELGRTDRNVDLRDLSLEPEHNSAWLFGFLKAFATDSSEGSFWSTRFEAASGRVSSIQKIGRDQSTFFEHGSVNQGHTHRGLLLGTPLIDRAGGSEFSVDRWSSQGRLGLLLFQRQMPPNLEVQQPAALQRTQWDVRFSGLRFLGKSELSWQAGNVWDLNRFPGRDVTSLYVSAGWRFGW